MNYVLSSNRVESVRLVWDRGEGVVMGRVGRE